MHRRVFILIIIGVLCHLGNAGSIEWQQVTPKPTNYDFVSSYIFNDTEIFTTGHSAVASSDFTAGILVRNGDRWEYTACYPNAVITIESLVYVPHLNKILGVGGGTLVTFDPKNISSGCIVSSIGGAYRLYAIATGNGFILAANSDSSELFSSTTGTYWKHTTNLPFQDFRGLVFDNVYNRFIVGSVNGTFASLNGEKWWKLDTNNDSLVFMQLKTYANKLVGTAYTKNYQTFRRQLYISESLSNTSVYWKNITPAPTEFEYGFLMRAEYGSTILVSIQTYAFQGYNTSIWQTDDFGNSWQQVFNHNKSFVPGTALRSRSEWLIGGNDGQLMSTTDWTTLTPIFPSYSLSTATFNHVTFVNGQFVVSAANAVYRSVDGYSWDKVSDNGFYSITYSPISNLYVGIPGLGIWTSPDLKNWTRSTIQQDNPNRLYFSHVPVQTKEGYLLVSGQIGSVFYATGVWLSQDGGLTWSKLPQQFGSSTCGSELAVLGYANSTLYLSCPYAYPVTLSTTNITADRWQRVDTNYYWFMAGGAGSVQDTLIALRDGGVGSIYQVKNKNWQVTQKFSDPYSTGTLPLPRAQLFVNGKFWTLFRSGQAFSSTDGATWTSETVPMYGIRHMTYGNGRYVAVGDHGIILVGKDIS